jgi:hypothetical protein
MCTSTARSADTHLQSLVPQDWRLRLLEVNVLFGIRTEASVVEQAKRTGCVRSEVRVVILKQAREPFTAQEAESGRGGKAEEEKSVWWWSQMGWGWDRMGCDCCDTELEKQTLAWELLPYDGRSRQAIAARQQGSSFLVSRELDQAPAPLQVRRNS